MSTNDFSSYFTPYKYCKPILEPSGEEGAFDKLMVDNMRICRHNGKFYCFYIGFNGKGYQTALAVSEDLLNWEKKGVVLPAGSGRAWDTNGRAISCLLCDIDLYGNRELIKKDGKYWMFYHAYPGVGYEVGAAANGIAWSTDGMALRGGACIYQGRARLLGRRRNVFNLDCSSQREIFTVL